jgi:hypothetical protein
MIIPSAVSVGGGVMVIKLIMDYGELVSVALKEGGMGKRVVGWVESYEDCWVLWPLCVFGCISVVVVEGVWERMEEEGEDRGKWMRRGRRSSWLLFWLGVIRITQVWLQCLEVSEVTEPTRSDSLP